ncbi:MFS transporter [Roseobacteraceae bacterium S113]
MKSLYIYVSCLVVCIGYGITFSHYAFLVSSTGVSGTWIGINAALPAAGWILGSILVPVLQLNLSLPIKRIAVGFLGLAGLGCCIPVLSDDFLSLCVTRLIFGGAIGVFFRCIEYILVANAPDDKRGRHLAFYGVCFLSGIVIGSSVQPALGNAVSTNAIAVIGLITIGCGIFVRSGVLDAKVHTPRLTKSALSLAPMVPIAFLGVGAYAVYEAVPAYLLQIYALRSGVDDAIAALTLSAAALGQLVLLFPILMLSDRMGRAKVLGACAVVAALLPFAIPYTLDESTIFLCLIALLGAAAGASYGLSLAMLGDRFEGQTLVLANALFGVIYASASVAGPLMHGVAMEFFAHGLMRSVSATFLILLLGMCLSVASSRSRGQRA